MTRPALAALAALLALAAPAAAQTTVAVPGVPAAGPSKYDRSFVTKIGPSSAKTVLVLMPGYAGGAGGFLDVGRDLVRQVPGLQVWAVDRRSQALEDPSYFQRGLRGDVTPQQVFDYYLGWLNNPQQQPRFTPPDTKSLGFARDWGLPTHLGDLRRVILSAKRQGRRVILGGHSLGGSMTAIYASWDFGRGRIGHEDLDGMVLIDGGALGAFDDTESTAEVRRRLKELEEKPFADLVGLGLPWATAVFLNLGGVYAQRAPDERSPFFDYPLLPAQFKPPVPATNRAFLNFALDDSTSPKSLELIHLRAGSLAPEGDPRGWVEGEVTPSERVARFAASAPVDGVEWYFPDRLRLDVDGASELERNAVTRQLKLRPWHLRDVDVPLYVFQTDLTQGRLLRGARRMISRSDIPRSRSLLVDRGSSTSHLDPLTAVAGRNDFVKTVVPWLKRTARR